MGSFVVCTGLSDRTGLLTGASRSQDGSLNYFVVVWRGQVTEVGSVAVGLNVGGCGVLQVGGGTAMKLVVNKMMGEMMATLAEGKLPV